MTEAEVTRRLYGWRTGKVHVSAAKSPAASDQATGPKPTHSKESKP